MRVRRCNELGDDNNNNKTTFVVKLSLTEAGKLQDALNAIRPNMRECRGPYCVGRAPAQLVIIS